MCPKAIDWGWSQFITSDRIQQDAFLNNDTLTIHASVTVKESCVQIDKEDADLYLKCAVEEAEPDSVIFSLQQGADINCKFKDDQYSPLHTACSWITHLSSSSSLPSSPCTTPDNNPNDQEEQLLLDGNNNNINDDDEEEEDPDENDIHDKNARALQVLQLLLEKGADPNAYNKWNETPLLIAANNGHLEAVEELLQHGADPSLCSEAGWSALTFAAHKGYADIAIVLLSWNAPVDPRVVDDNSTPLHKACAGNKEGHSNCVELLVASKADVHALNKWRETPLLTAANHGHTRAVKTLLRAGADPCICTDTGWSPLSIAAYKGHDDVVQLLLDEGAPTEEDDPTLSALLQAATKGLSSTVLLLLKYGADHSVTTKKGDTALSILVEQNLIETAVDMVEVYGASIPRCSRDRKKVQRARLLINHRMKLLMDGDLDSGDANPNHDSVNNDDEPSLSAEMKAKAAEEALLQELEAEETKAKKIEAEANTKKAKKKKKKEMERQLRLKEEQERQKKEEEERLERERAEREKAEKMRKEKERLRKEQDEKEMKAALERQKLLAAKQREKERKEQKLQAASASTGNSNHPSKANHEEILRRPVKGTQSEPSTPSGVQERKVHTPRRYPNGSHPGSPPLQKTISISQPSSRQNTPIMNRSVSDGRPMEQLPATGLSPRVKSVGSRLEPSRKPLSLQNSAGGMAVIEIPLVSVFRKDKMGELVRRCSQSMRIVTEAMIRRIIYRWVVRASHSTTEFVDPFIPSWTDYDKLVTFFQRQLIQESNRSKAILDIEALKNAGSSIASLCDGYAKEILNYRMSIQNQVGSTWNDLSIGVTAENGSPGTRDGLTLSLNGRSPVVIDSGCIAKLRQRYTGPQDKLASAIYVTKLWYDTFDFLLQDPELCVKISSSNASSLASESGVSYEILSDPFVVHGMNGFRGQFEAVDKLFGGREPLGKESSSLPEMIAGPYSSAVVLTPFDNVLSSLYLNCILNTIDDANSQNLSVSFVVLIPAESFFDLPSGPTKVDDLAAFDSRLSSFPNSYVSHFDVLQGGKHVFVTKSEEETEVVINSNTAILVLQSVYGKLKFSMDRAGFSRLKDTFLRFNFTDEGSILPQLSMGPVFSTNGPLAAPRASLYDHTPSEPLLPLNPEPSLNLVNDRIPVVGETLTGGSFSVPPSGGRRRGRLFGLVDDAEEDHEPLELVSGVLNNLDMGLFQSNGNNVGSDVDIEAISLMGIGSGRQGTHTHSQSHR